MVVVYAAWPSLGRGQWIERPGRGWFQTSLFHHDTRDRFDPQGEVAPLFNEGSRSVTTSLFFTGVAGVYRGVDAWVQFPIHRLAFNDVAATRVSFGFGDPVFHLRLGPALFGADWPVPVAIRAGVKLPLGDFPVDSEIVPLTEGQRDWEMLLEIGQSFYPRPLYAMAWVGYRWREPNRKIDREPGDERFGLFALGGAYARFNWKLAVEALFGKKWVSLTGVRIPLAMSERKLVQLTPSAGWKNGSRGLRAGYSFPGSRPKFPGRAGAFHGIFFAMEPEGNIKLIHLAATNDGL